MALLNLNVSELLLRKKFFNEFYSF